MSFSSLLIEHDSLVEKLDRLEVDTPEWEQCLQEMGEVESKIYGIKLRTVEH